MKKLVYTLVTLTLLFTACNDDDENSKDIGIITGTDARLCACCGGWFIDIKDNTYRFVTLPDNFDNLKVNEEFPIKVLVDWRPDPEACIGDEIIVEKIYR